MGLINNKLETLVVHDIFTVMEKDSLETSHPVSTYVEDPNQVQQYFDEISYEKVRAVILSHLISIERKFSNPFLSLFLLFEIKGLSVLRMLRGFIGDQNFKTALRVF